MATGKNSQLTAELMGTPPAGDYATPATNKLKAQALLDLIEPENTTVWRGYMDEMSPAARIQLIVDLRALVAALVNV